MSLSSASTGLHTMTKILVIGGGLTSSVTCSLIKDAFPQADKLELTAWDKARGAGGRMATSRSSNNKDCTVDLGAQYITRAPKYDNSHRAIYDELISKDLLAPLTAPIDGMRPQEPNSVNFVTPKGVSSLVKHFFTKADVKVQFENQITNVTKNAMKWNVATQNGKNEVPQQTSNEEFCIILK